MLVITTGLFSALFMTEPADGQVKHCFLISGQMRCVLLRPARELMSGALTSRERVEARCRQVAKRGYGFNFSVFVDPHLNEAPK